MEIRRAAARHAGGRIQHVQQVLYDMAIIFMTRVHAGRGPAEGGGMTGRQAGSTGLQQVKAMAARPPKRARFSCERLSPR